MGPSKGHDIPMDAFIVIVELSRPVKIRQADDRHCSDNGIKGAAFLSAVCIKESGIKIQDHSLWHLNMIDLLSHSPVDRKELLQGISIHPVEKS